MALRFPPVVQFLERFRSLLRRRARFDFDQEVARALAGREAVAFLALLELRKQRRDRDRPGRPVRADQDCARREGHAETKGAISWTARSA